MSDFISALDCQRFGFKIAKINGWDNSVADTVGKLRHESIKLIITRVNSEDLSLINQLENQGFRLKDSQLTYQYNISQQPDEVDMAKLTEQLAQQNKTLIIRDFIPTDLLEIKDIAYNSFLGYGHYFANQKLDRTRCAEIYPDWAVNCCSNKNLADKVLIAEIEGVVVGFVAFKIHENDQKYAAAVINAVSEKYRGYGIYQGLVKKSLIWCYKNNCKWQEHNVLIGNIPVQHALGKLGFRVKTAWMTLHCWLDS